MSEDFFDCYVEVKLIVRRKLRIAAPRVQVATDLAMAAAIEQWLPVELVTQDQDRADARIEIEISAIKAEKPAAERRGLRKPPVRIDQAA